MTATLSSTLVARVTAGGAREPDGPEPPATDDLETEVACLTALVDRLGIVVPGRTPYEPRG